MKKQKYIYVVMSKTLTRPGKLIRRITGGKYSHASISLDIDLNQMYSFARYQYQSPLVGGFTHETLTSLSLGKNEEVIVRIYQIPVTRYQYKMLKKNINHFKKHKKDYMYNLFALVLYPMHINFKIRDSYICTGFVSQLLAQIGVKNEYLGVPRISPDRMVEVLSEYEYYTGSLQEYIKMVDHLDVARDYLERESFIVVAAKSVKQVVKLIFRKIV